MVAGLNVIVAPAGTPDAESEMAESKPPETVVVTVETRVPPQSGLSEEGDRLIVKSPVVEVVVTVKSTVVV